MKETEKTSKANEMERLMTRSITMRAYDLEREAKCALIAFASARGGEYTPYDRDDGEDVFQTYDGVYRFRGLAVTGEGDDRCLYVKGRREDDNGRPYGEIERVRHSNLTPMQAIMIVGIIRDIEGIL